MILFIIGAEPEHKISSVWQNIIGLLRNHRERVSYGAFCVFLASAITPMNCFECFGVAASIGSANKQAETNFIG